MLDRLANGSAGAEPSNKAMRQRNMISPTYSALPVTDPDMWLTTRTSADLCGEDTRQCVSNRAL